MDRVNIFPNQRVNIDDYEDGAGGRLVQEDQIREGRIFLLPSGRTTGSAATSARIFGGFGWATNPVSSATATLVLGSGVFPVRDDDNNVVFGLIFGDEGATQAILDFSSGGTATHAVYVRAASTNAVFQNRVFWNPSGPNEFVDNVATRKVASWESTFRLATAASPGDDWVKIWEVTTVANVITAVTDYRHFFYEGDAVTTYGPDWGDGATDRSTDRSTYGISDQNLWVQAVRRQLTDIIGKTGWWDEPSGSLEDVFSIAGRFVTVDKPGGAGGDGDYATLNAAVTALGAASGGTILLQAGTYDITAVMSINKRINIIGVDDGVILSNNQGGSGYLITYSTGSDYSIFQGVEITEGASSTEKALAINQSRIAIRQCNIVGEIGVGATNVFIEQCDITGSATNANSDQVLLVSGSGTSLKVDNCRISVGTNVAKTNTIYVTATDGRVTFQDCKIIGNENTGVAPGLFRSTGSDIAFYNCDLLTAPFGAYHAIYPDTGTESALFDHCRISVLSGVSDNLSKGVFKSLVSGSEKSMSISHCVFNFEDYLQDGSSAADIAFHIFGSGRVHHSTFLNIKMPNAATAPNLDAFFTLDVTSADHVSMDHCTFRNISSEASGLINMNLIGQSPSLSGDGKVSLSNLRIIATAKTYRGADTGSMISFTGSTDNSLNILDCFLEGGTWETIIRTTAKGCMVRGNTFIFPSTTPDIDSLVTMTGLNAASVNGYGIFSHNFILHETIQTAYVVELSGYKRATATDNIIMNVGTAATASLRIDNVDYGVLLGNSCEDGVVFGTVATTQIPPPAYTATPLADLNT